MTRAAVHDLWERIEPILDNALELPPKSWSAYLDKTCGSDAALRMAVERLLVSAGTTSDPVDADIGAIKWAQPLFIEREIPMPARIGPYVIDQVLGHGGMGSVYLAKRDGAELGPRVALKVMRSGLDQDRVLLRRFAEERQILATLEHPGIARLLEGGVTSEGHPWLAMEYVDGMPLNRYVESYSLPLVEKLLLFRQILSAVSYAHRNLVVHRDLKPSNILVTSDGTIKLLDFGIAKLLAPSVADDAPITRTGFQPFTPDYASPEQVFGEPVTTAADIYSLGVVLYELLTGERPLKLARENPADWGRLIRESMPRLPSAVAHDGKMLRGDLDMIVLKALRREPERRYATVDWLDDDVRRHLEERPVLARADSQFYRTRVFIRRHRVAVIIATIGGIGLSSLALAVRYQDAMLKQEAARTKAQRDQASAVTHTLWSLLGQLNDSTGHPLSVAAVLDQAEPAIDKQYQNQPNVRATMQSALGEIYLSNGDRVRAESLLRKAVASQRADGRDSAGLATHLETLARLLNGNQQFAGAESAATEARAIRSRLTPGSIDEEATASLGTALMNTERYREAEAVLRELVTVQGERGSRTPGSSGAVLLGETLGREGRNEEAASLFRGELARMRETPESDSTGMANVLSYLAATHAMLGQNAAADSLYLEAYQILGGTLPLQYQRTARGSVLASRAELAVKSGDDAKAMLLVAGARALWTRSLTPDDYRWATLDRVEALVLRDRNQPAAAASLLSTTLDKLSASPHPNLYMYRRTQSTLADVYDRWGRADSAAAHRALARPGAPLMKGK